MRTADERRLSGTVHRQHAALLVVRQPASVFHICNASHSFQDGIICTNRKKKYASKPFQDPLNTVVRPICKILARSETLREKSPLTVEVAESHVTKCVRAHVGTTKERWLCQNLKVWKLFTRVAVNAFGHKICRFFDNAWQFECLCAGLLW